MADDFDEIIKAADAMTPCWVKSEPTEKAKPEVKVTVVKTEEPLTVEIVAGHTVHFKSHRAARSVVGWTGRRLSMSVLREGDEWILKETDRYNEYTRGRFKTEEEAWARLNELNMGPQVELPVEDITDAPRPTGPLPPKYLRKQFNKPENMWLVIGGPNQHSAKVIERFKLEGQATRYVRALKRRSEQHWGKLRLR